jgi:hypothetical protein
VFRGSWRRGPYNDVKSPERPRAYGDRTRAESFRRPKITADAGRSGFVFEPLYQDVSQLLDFVLHLRVLAPAIWFSPRCDPNLTGLWFSLEQQDERRGLDLEDAAAPGDQKSESNRFGQMRMQSGVFPAIYRFSDSTPSYIGVHFSIHACNKNTYGRRLSGVNPIFAPGDLQFLRLVIVPRCRSLFSLPPSLIGRLLTASTLVLRRLRLCRIVD